MHCRLRRQVLYAERHKGVLATLSSCSSTGRRRRCRERQTESIRHPTTLDSRVLCRWLLPRASSEWLSPLADMPRASSLGRPKRCAMRQTIQNGPISPRALMPAGAALRLDQRALVDRLYDARAPQKMMEHRCCVERASERFSLLH